MANSKRSLSVRAWAQSLVVSLRINAMSPRTSQFTAPKTLLRLLTAPMSSIQPKMLMCNAGICLVPEFA
eukprot:3403775-Lingulodinium_polyedra.AAC.1